MREIYKGGNDIKPGKYYYFVDTRKPVPYQTKRVDGTSIQKSLKVSALMI